LEPPAAPSDPASAMYTLQDVYNRLTTGATTNKRAGGFTEPTSGPTAGTMRTVDEIYSNAIPTQIPKTGAGDWFGSYTPVEGEDSHASMRKGAVWPNPRFTVGTGTSSNCVTDNLTGLMWLRNPVATTRNWSDAIAYCEGLDGSDGRGGYTDWRLPNIDELSCLVVHGWFNPPLCNTAGTGKWADWDPFYLPGWPSYWSSTTLLHTGWTTKAWYINFWYGIPDNYTGANKTDLLCVWPVRGGK